MRNNKLPTTKTASIITVKASNPPIVNGRGAGGSGGGIGQDASQSVQEQAGALS